MAGADQSPLVWRILFSVAAAYNIALGSWAIFCPQAMFELFELEMPVHPWLWSCIGMVVGVYGLGYAFVAWKPEEGDVLALVGLTGKVLGPFGWLWHSAHGQIATQTFAMILLNDLIWWFPFAAYLMRHWRLGSSALVLLVAGVHFIGSLLLLAVSGGTELQPDVEMRLSYIQMHAALWIACWFTWTVCSLGLAAFFILWAIRLHRFGVPWLLLVLPCALAFVGCVFDLLSEYRLITAGRLDRAATASVEEYLRIASLSGAGLANGLYCIGGVTMTAISWRARFQRGAIALVACVTWSLGAGLTVATLLEHRAAMTLFGAGLMLVFIPWLAATGLNFASNPPSVQAEKDFLKLHNSNP